MVFVDINGWLLVPSLYCLQCVKCDKNELVEKLVLSKVK